MFSGLTNQVTSWMGSAKGEQEEKVPTPEENVAGAINPEKSDASSPTKQKSKLDMLSNMKTQIGGIGGWLGSSIPKLRKGEENQVEGGEDNPVLVDEGSTIASAESIKGSPMQKDDDDNSSATGGADSGPQSAAETPTEDKEGQFGNVQSKALAGAKSFGSFLYSAVNKAGKAVTETSAKIKETVEKNTILGEFNKEQDAFMKQQAINTAANLPPWTGCPNEEALKEECLSLSTDRRNFVRSPPAGVDFKFDYEVLYPVAVAIMEQDSNLEKMRYELVPKVINEENFWRNYFYRVSLICQANELSVSREGDSQSAAIENFDQPLEEEWERELEAELQDYEVVCDQKATNPKNDSWEQEIDDILEEVHDLK